MKHADFTTAPITAALALPAIIEPEWVDVPGATRLSSIGRSLLYELIDEGSIKSITLRRRGKAKGKRLISVSSLKSWLESWPSGIERDVSRQMKRVRRARRLAKTPSG